MRKARGIVSYMFFFGAIFFLLSICGQAQAKRYVVIDQDAAGPARNRYEFHSGLSAIA